MLAELVLPYPYQDDPLPMEIIELDEEVTDVKKIQLHIYRSWGGRGQSYGGGGLDYFDIIRNDPYSIMSDAKQQCEAKASECKSKAQFCSNTNCIPDTIWWQDENNLKLNQRGCSMIGQDVIFQSSAKCVKKDTLEQLSPPYIIDTTDASLMEDCTAWTDTEACDKKTLALIDIGNIADDRVHTNMFQIYVADDCSDEGVKIETVDSTTMTPSGEFLSYLDKVNSTLEVGEEEQCLTMVHGLCGPDSISFHSPQNLFVTFCDDTILLKEEFDHCG